MKGDRKLRGNHGFTIVETMIFLAVSGLMLVSAIVLVSGQQENTEFTQAINLIKSQVQAVATDVVNGYYTNLSNFSCTPQGNTNETITAIGAGAPKQGSNNGCIFFGKAIQFGLNKETVSANQNYDVYTIVGAECADGGACDDLAQDTQSSSIYNVYPTVLISSNGATDSTKTESLQAGLNVTCMTVNATTCTAGGSQNVGVVAFTQTLADGSGIGGGGEVVSLYAIASTEINYESEAEVVDSINSDANWETVSSVEVCFSSGSTTQSGLMTIGSENRQISVTLKLYSDLTCT